MSAIVGNIDISEFDGDGLDIIGTDGFNVLTGSQRADFIDAKDGNDVVFGKKGDDLIDGGAGNDIIKAGKGDDSVIGRGGDDIILGGSGDDVIEAGGGHDEIFGDGGNDLINGGHGNDTILGGDWMDTVNGGAGSDLLLGGIDADVFEFDAEDFSCNSMDTIADFQLNEDRLVIKGLSDNDEVAFDGATGSVSVNGHDVISFSSGDVFGSSEPRMEENEDGDFELM